MEPDKLVKVVFDLKGDELMAGTSESVWAQLLSNGYLKIDNIPFYVRGISLNDLVEGELIADGVYRFKNVKEHSGHSTYRVYWSAAKGSRQYERSCKKLTAFGCGYEQGLGQLGAVDVPPNVDIDTVDAYLEKMEEDGVWEFEEGHHRPGR